MIEPAPYHRDYEITDAMFGAFRTSGGTAYFFKLLAWTTVFLSVVNFFAVPIMIGGYLDFLGSMAIAGQNPEDFGAIFSGIGALLLSSLLMFFGYVLVASLARAAFFRAYFFADMGGSFPFRFGSDELRQALAYLGFYGLFYLFMIGLYLVAVIVFGVIFGLGAGISGGEPNAFMIILAVTLGLLGYVALMAAMIWFPIRLLPAGALTALRVRTHVLAARKVSQGRFWPLFASVLVAGIIAYVVFYITMIIAMMIGFVGLSGPEIAVMMSGLDPEASFEALSQAVDGPSFRIAAIFAIILYSAGYAFFCLMVAGPPAFFTRQWAEASGLYGKSAPDTDSL